jgi:hypothetical protein
LNSICNTATIRRFHKVYIEVFYAKYYIHYFSSHMPSTMFINPNKTVIIPFTRRRNIKGLKKPVLFNKKIQLSSDVKYLGLTLDKGLTWRTQLDKVINRAYKAFWTCRGMFGKTWGLQPHVVYWIYTAVVRPIITSGVTVWWHRVRLKTSQAKLSKLQLLTCLGITGAQLHWRYILDSLHCIYSWKQRRGGEFTVSSAVINGNLDPVGPDMYA